MKQIITIIIIVAALAGAGVFGYMMFTGADSAITTTSSQDAPSNILPMGSKLDFDIVQQFNKNQQIYQYPQVNQGEVGPVMGTMIKQ